jgi:hypothetical protein
MVVPADTGGRWRWRAGARWRIWSGGGSDTRRWVAELLASVADTLAAHGGTAGILCDQAPPPLCGRAGVDALVVSTDNEMTEDPVNENRE